MIGEWGGDTLEEIEAKNWTPTNALNLLELILFTNYWKNHRFFLSCVQVSYYSIRLELVID